MKKITAIVLMLAMCVCLFAGCSEETTPNESAATSDLATAKEYLHTMYKDGNEVTVADYKVVGVVVIGDMTYNVDWTSDSDTVKFVRGDDKMVTVDIDERNPEEVTYTLTATLSDAEGNKETVSFQRRVPAAIIIEEGMSYEEIVEAAYKLPDGIAMEGTYTLFGKVISIDTPWSEDYQNITVTIQVGDMSDKPIMCYRLKGEGAKDLKVGDEITVTGTLKNYKGTIEFDAGCELVGVGEVVDQTNILDAAYSLEDGIAMTEPCTLIGKIVSIDTPWSEDYQNITVTMDCGDSSRLIMCYRLKGEGAKELGIGDTITVTGILKNYKGTIEFDAGCELIKVVKNSEPAPEAPTDPTAIVDAAYALEVGASLPYTATLTGKIVSVDTPWSDQYNNITVSIAVEGREDKPIMCYRLKGDGAKDLKVGDVITVTGNIKNYNGTIEFVSGCTIGEGSGETEAPAVGPTDPAEILKAAYALNPGESLPYTSTLTGKIISTPYYWSEKYQNISVVIEVEGFKDMPVYCYRLKGEGAKDLFWGDTITVTGTLTNYKGSIQFGAGCTVSDIVPGTRIKAKPTTDLAKIFGDIATLEPGDTLMYESKLTGYVSAITTKYSATYGNITVMLQVPGYESQEIQCYRMSGEGIENIERGDIITVVGYVVNYNGKIQMDQGCKMTAITKGDGRLPGDPLYATPEEIMDAAYKLAAGETLEGGNYTLTGKIVSIDTAYSDSYKNVTVTMEVAGKTIQCFRLKGNGADVIAEGDTITVTGTIMNYSGKVQFSSGCTLDEYVKNMTPAEIVAAAYALLPGESLPGEYTLTGVISKVNTAFSSKYHNVTVTIIVGGDTAHPIMCYRLQGDGADIIDVGDTITVSGVLKNYNGTIEFDAGCNLDSYVEYLTPEEIMERAYALEKGESLPGTYTLTGKIVSIDTVYSSKYKNITVTMEVAGKTIQCFRLKGTGADVIAVGDTITVTGVIKNYNGTIEFDAGCTLDSYTKP